MADANETTQIPNENPAPPNQSPVPGGNDAITMTKEEYAGLIGQMAQMQAFIESVQAANTQDSKPAPAQIDPTDIDRLSNTQMLQMIGQQVTQMIQQANQPVLQAVMTLSVKEEMREVEKEYPDFKDFKKDVYEIASKNTSISLRDAYLLAKSGKQPPAPQKLENNNPNPTPAPTPTPSERPNLNQASLKASTSMSVADAAREALKELKYT